jgi:hypothetical protein
VIGPLFILAVIVGLTLWVIHPFTRPNQLWQRTSEDNTVALLAAKQATYRSIVDLELDHKVGKVSDADYLAMRKQQELEAIELLRALDAEVSHDSMAELIEKEILEVRRNLNNGG